MKAVKNLVAFVSILLTICVSLTCLNPVLAQECNYDQKEWKEVAKNLAGSKGCVDAGDRNQFELVTGCRYPKRGEAMGYPVYCEGDDTDEPTW